MRRAVAAALADLRAAPGGALLRQYAHGEEVDLLEARGDAARVLCARDGLEGWMAAGALGAPGRPTHRVRTLCAHLYAEPDIRAQTVMRLPFGARVTIGRDAPGAAGGGGAARFAACGEGWIPRAQVRPDDAPENDPVAVAERFLGVPYLWGGDGADGIDCSGLVQAALLACGTRCPADSGPQRATFGRPVAGDPVASPRGALLFWAGHVAMARGDGSMIHANAGAMAVAVEGIATGIARIEAGGDGPLLAAGGPA